MKRLPTWTIAIAILLVFFSCFLLWFYFTFIGRPAVYNGRRVARKTEWYGYSQILPIPTGRFSVSYGYQDQAGVWIPEGPYTGYFPNGNVRVECYYVHGQLDGKQSIFNEAGIEIFRTYWTLGIEVHRIQCPCVDP